MSTEAQRREIYSTSRWRRLRAQVLVRDGHLCQPCKRDGRVGPAAIVHHLRGVEEHRDGIWDIDNLESTCRRCHGVEHKEMEAHRLPPDVRAWRKFQESFATCEL